MGIKIFVGNTGYSEAGGKKWGNKGIKNFGIFLVLRRKTGPGSSIHDFRIVPGEKRTNLIFDLVVPREIPASRDKELAAELGRMVQEKDDTCCCVITVERSFCAPFHEEKDKE